MRKYCVIGYPIGHSLSPKIHNREFRALKLDARYEAIEVKPERLAQFMKNFRENFSGASVTIPHKEKIIKFLDKLSPEARAIGAVNAIVNLGGKLIGYNTDVFGAMSAIRKFFSKKLRGKRAVVLGAGGAARAIAYGLKKAGAKVKILNRTLLRAKRLAADFGCGCGRLSDFNPSGCDLIVNATSVGMWRSKAKYFEESPLPQLKNLLRGLRKKPAVMDIIYRPRMTKLLKDAKKAGCKIITGDYMFLSQAAKSFELWTGRSSLFQKF